MPAFIAVLVEFFQNLGPAISGLISAVSAIVQLFKLFHNSSSGIVERSNKMKELHQAASSANKTGNVKDLMSAVSNLPNTVSE
jgi:hypothetical protein